MTAAVGSLFLFVASFFVLTAAFFVLVKLVHGLGWMVRGLFRGIAHVVAHLARFVKGMLVDTVNFAGSVLTGAIIGALAVLNLGIGRWRSFRHYGGEVKNELASALGSLYRVSLGHPLRLAFLGPIVRRFEDKVPAAMHRAPSGRGKRQPGVFEGYEVLGTLPAGGSGAQLFLARPKAHHAAALADRHSNVPDRVVIKSFVLGLGSTLPQMIREGRALEAARRLGLLVEHQLSDTSFYYVMPFVDGEEVGRLTEKLHAEAPREGLGEGSLRLVLTWGGDLLRTLERFHTGGLWHKDIKPANVIVADGRAHLVDFGLVTPLASGMTLTTHGTEYYRDPEMVRLAMRGVKVHEVDGVKFDLYSAGALLYSMVEGSFPAHGSLSQISKRCPEALRWIIRRSMADLDSRYGSAEEMRADLDVVRAARDPFALRPADLPSLGGERVRTEAPADEREPASLYAAADSTGSEGAPRPARRRRGLRRAATVAAGLAVAVTVLAVHEEHQDDRRAAARRAHAQQVARVNDGVQASTGVHASERGDDRGPAGGVTVRELLPRSLALVLDEVEGVEPTFLVLSDGITWARHAEAIEAYAQEAGELGFRVLDREDDRPGDLDLIAGAHNAVQFRDPSDSEAVEDLQRFLDDAEDLDAILWVATSGKRTYEFTLLTRDAWRRFDASQLGQQTEDAAACGTEAPCDGESLTYKVY